MDLLIKCALAYLVETPALQMNTVEFRPNKLYYYLTIASTMTVTSPTVLSKIYTLNTTPGHNVPKIMTGCGCKDFLFICGFSSC